MAGTANKVILVGRLTRDPETRTFQSGGSVCNFGFAVEESKKNQQTGQWEDSPVWLDCAAFTSAENKGAGKIVEQYCHKGDRIYIEGRLSLDQWQDKNTGQNRSKLKIIVEKIILLQPKGDNSGQQGPPPQRRQTAPPNSGGYDAPPDNGGDDYSQIPF